MWGLMSVDLRERINKYPLPAMAGFIGWHVTDGNACLCLFIGEQKFESHSLRPYFVCYPDWSQRQQVFAEHRLRSRQDTSGDGEQSRVVHMSGVNFCERTGADHGLIVCLHQGEATDVLQGEAGRVSEPSQSLCFQLPWKEPPWGGLPGLGRGVFSPQGSFWALSSLHPWHSDHPVGWARWG